MRALATEAITAAVAAICSVIAPLVVSCAAVAGMLALLTRAYRAEYEKANAT